MHGGRRRQRRGVEPVLRPPKLAPQAVLYGRVGGDGDPLQPVEPGCWAEGGDLVQEVVQHVPLVQQEADRVREERRGDQAGRASRDGGVIARPKRVRHERGARRPPVQRVPAHHHLDGTDELGHPHRPRGAAGGWKPVESAVRQERQQHRPLPPRGQLQQQQRVRQQPADAVKEDERRAGGAAAAPVGPVEVAQPPHGARAEAEQLQHPPDGAVRCKAAEVDGQRPVAASERLAGVCHRHQPLRPAGRQRPEYRLDLVHHSVDGGGLLWLPLARVAVQGPRDKLADVSVARLLPRRGRLLEKPAVQK
mmetsp:Transcript_4235/g.12377  ORF Transcript_4235/g.12377 Transcript_4235/m.12377 type:complete len:307 (-) Transcript_4235:143-1063(-)